MTSLGKNVSETYLTKRGHQLVIHGPNQWVRHPLYTLATVALLALSLIASREFFLATALLAFLSIAVLVVPREEAARVDGT